MSSCGSESAASRLLTDSLARAPDCFHIASNSSDGRVPVGVILFRMTLDNSPLMDSFDDVWPQLVGFARANDRVATLSRESENELWYDADEEQLVVRSVGPNTEGTAHELPYDNLK